MLGGVSVLAPVVPPLVLGPLAFAGILALTFASARFVDRRPIVDLGLGVGRAQAMDFAAGTLVGLLAVAFVAVVESALGVAEYHALPVDTTRAVQVGFVAVFFGGVAVQEELVFRGYHLLNLSEGLEGRRVPRATAAVLATTLSACGFGAAHLGNDGASVISTLQVAVAGGSLLAIGLLVTGDLACSVGVHFAWNLAQCLFGMPVSGFVLSHAALATRVVSGDPLLTGGDFGPEASVVGLGGMIVGTLGVLGYLRIRSGALAVRLRTFKPSPPPAPSSSELPSGDR